MLLAESCCWLTIGANPGGPLRSVERCEEVLEKRAAARGQALSAEDWHEYPRTYSRPWILVHGLDRSTYYRISLSGGCRPRTQGLDAARRHELCTRLGRKYDADPMEVFESCHLPR